MKNDLTTPNGFLKAKDSEYVRLVSLSRMYGKRLMNGANFKLLVNSKALCGYLQYR